MSKTHRQIAKTEIANNDGDWVVSTIRTDSGGADANYNSLSPFTSLDYIDETPWKFETMVFKQGSSKGFYHQPYAKLSKAKAGHLEAVKLLTENNLEIGKGVKGTFGVPSTTPEDWLKSQSNNQLTTENLK